MRVLAMLLGLALAAPGASLAQVEEDALAVTGVEARAGEEAATLVFTMTAPAKAEVFTLTGPDRAVIDLPPFDWRAGRVAPAALPHVAGLRHGLFRHDRGRIVLDLSRPVAIRRAETRSAPEGQGAALVLELAPTTPEGFAVTAGWPPGARWEAAGRRTPPKNDDVVVLIDPGHGGIDPGASAEDLVEKELTLEVGRRLAAALDARPGITAVMTRRDDRFLPLRARLQIAREVGANALVSLHADTLARGEAEGMSFYTLSRRGVDAAAETFAERENRADVLAGADLSGRDDMLTRVLIDLARRATSAESIALARGMRDALEGRTPLLDSRPHRFGNFYVLKAPDIPSVLVELGFLDNADDRERITDPDWQGRVTGRLADAIAAWVSEAPEGFLTRRE